MVISYTSRRGAATRKIAQARLRRWHPGLASSARREFREYVNGYEHTHVGDILYLHLGHDPDRLFGMAIDEELR